MTDQERGTFLHTRSNVLRRLALIIACFAGVLLPQQLASQAGRPGTASPARFDVLITGARVFDGTGNPWFYADIGVRDGRIAAVGRLAGATAARVIDAKGKAVAPGFIDIHSHADDGGSPEGGLRDPNPRRRAAPNLVSQGVTTVVVNQDGRSPWPIREQRAALEKQGIALNVLMMVGHGTVREQVMGRNFKRAATPDEVRRMAALVRQGMQEGAAGLSAGLEYVPGRWSTTDELVALAREIAPFHGVYISHERSEGSDPMWYWPSRDSAGAPNLLDAVRETIEIGEQSGATVVASHIKTKGANYWGSSRAAIGLIERARARGVDVWADQYSYNTSGSDGGTVLIPEWALGYDKWGDETRDVRPDFSGALRRVLADSAKSAMLRRDIAHEIARRGGAENVLVLGYSNSALVGKNLAELASAHSESTVDAAIRLQLEGSPTIPGGGRFRGFSMSEIDMEAFAAQPWIATSSDAGITLPEDGPDVHARFYGTFPRKIRHYAMERGVLSVEGAIRTMTSLPAQIMGIRDRGLIREGMDADLVVFDLGRIRDKATFSEPHQYAEGIDEVMVNGVFTVDGGKLTWKLPGVVIPR